MAITNAQLAQKLNEFLEFYATNYEEFNDWMTGAVGGGPGLDGRYPLTDRGGTTAYWKSPAQLDDDVSNLVTGAAGHKTAAQTAQTAAEAAQALAEAARDTTLGYRDTANQHRIDAAASASAAATDATTANAERVLTTAIKGYATEWANADEDVLVSAAAGGDQVDDYSAKHHAIKAAASAAAAVVAAATGISGSAEGDILVWNNSLMQWETAQPASGVPDGTSGGDTLWWNGAAWAISPLFRVNTSTVEMSYSSDAYQYFRQWNPNTSGGGIALRTGSVANGQSALEKINNLGQTNFNYMRFQWSDGKVFVDNDLEVLGQTVVPWNSGIKFDAGSAVIKAGGSGGNSVGIKRGSSTAAYFTFFDDADATEGYLTYDLLWKGIDADHRFGFSQPSGGVSTTGKQRNTITLVDSVGTTVSDDAKVGIDAVNSDGDGLGWLTWYNGNAYLRVGADSNDGGVGTDGSFIRLDGWNGSANEILAVFTIGAGAQFYYDGSLSVEFGATNTISINGSEAFRGNDAWLRLNQAGGFTSGTYTPGLFRADGGFRTGVTGYSVDTSGNNYIRSITGQYGTVELNGAGTGGYHGISLGGKSVFMDSVAGTAAGIYGDDVNHWKIRFDNGSGNVVLYNAGSAVAATDADGMIRQGAGNFIFHATDYGAGALTISTAAASGGTNGDIWFRY